MGKIDPDIIVLNETLYRNNERTKLKNYRSFNKNRENKNGGGIEILIKNSMENRTITISEGSQEIEELTIRTETRKRAINIITLYGKIEGRVNREKIREQFTHLEELINNIESAERGLYPYRRSKCKNWQRGGRNSWKQGRNK